MRRQEIIDGVNNFVSALKTSQILASFRIREGNADSLAKAATALADYKVLASRFGATENEISKIMGLDVLTRTDEMARLIMKGTSPETARISRAIAFSEDHLPKLVALLGQNTAPQGRTSGRGTPSPSDLDVIEIDLIEPENRASRLERLRVLLESVDSLHDSICEIREITAVPLALLACDSGSDKSFWVQGASAAINELKAIILQMWRRSIYYREVSASLRVKLVAESLPILEQINAARDAGKIDGETANRLHYSIVVAATQFIESGATIPEIYKEAGFEPREIMKPDTKLLSGPPDSGSTLKRRSQPKKGPSTPDASSEDELEP